MKMFGFECLGGCCSEDHLFDSFFINEKVLLKHALQLKKYLESMAFSIFRVGLTYPSQHPGWVDHRLRLPPTSEAIRLGARGPIFRGGSAMFCWEDRF